MNKTQKILLTGGGGFFASRFAQHYKDRYDIIAPRHAELDVTDESGVIGFIRDTSPDIIIHTGAVAVTDFCNENPDIAHRINVEGSVNIARGAVETDSRLVFISTEQIFNGSAKGGPFTEESEPEPNTVYGENKWEAEQLLTRMVEKVWIVRFTWMFDMPVYGCGMSGNILMDTLTKLTHRQTICASKREFRGMGYVQETVRNFETLLSCPYGVWNMGAENPLNRYDVVRHILSLLRIGEDDLSDYLTEDTEHYLDHNRDVRLDVSKAAKEGMEWTKTPEALEKCLRDYRVIR